ncbi:MAG TPA: OmpA family protein [Tepidisphaeraceae bacterium]|nr:OmpA family protein [Tepidisphaeraceae bacterium]
MRRITTIALPVAALFAVGCQNPVHDENLALHRENRELRGQNDQLLAKTQDLEQRLGQAPDPAQLTSLQSDLASRDQRIKELESQLRQPTPGAGPQPGIEGIETSYDARAGTLTVNLPGEVLFVSGSDALKDSAKATLNKIVNAVKRDYTGKPVRVQGYTDTDPINKTKDRYQDNLDLSLNRAAAVSRYLIEKGVEPKSITTSGLGQWHPKGSKAASRRVEIVVVIK